ncbi:retrovirus-related pol polyprotein from transposon TNT 1-94 [Tanacetum coccineum]
MTIIRLVLSIVALKELHLEQLDVKTAFLHGDLVEDIYMARPASFQSARKEENLVCKLKKSMYGLKQAPRQWIRHGRDQEAQEEKYIGKVLEKFNMKDAEARCQPLGEEFKLSKKQAPKTEASRRRMTKVPYALVVGNVICQVAPTLLERYFEGYPLFQQKKAVLEGFSDSDYGGCLDSSKSTAGYVFTMGGTPFSWMSRFRSVSLCQLPKPELESEGKILGVENHADMLTKVVTIEKTPCIESLLALCLVSAACSVCSAVQEGWGNSIVEGNMVLRLQRLLEMERSEKALGSEQKALGSEQKALGSEQKALGSEQKASMLI